jgi:hypothetical protein
MGGAEESGGDAPVPSALARFRASIGALVHGLPRGEAS